MLSYISFSVCGVNLTLYKKFAIFSNFILLFCVLIDPTNALFHFKDIAFLVFIAINLPFAKFDRIWILLIFLAGYGFCFSLGTFFSESLDLVRTFAYLKSFLFLSYIFWMDDSELFTIKFFYYLCILICLIEIFILAFLNFTPFRIWFLDFNYEKDYWLLIANRRIIGLRFNMIYFRTSSCCVLALGLAFVRFFNTKKIKYLIHILILFMGLVISGTRANILSALLIIFSLFLFWTFFEKKATFFFTSFMCVFFLLVCIVVFLLLNQEGDFSLNIKQLHIKSFKHLFISNPLKFFFRGMGPGGNFYSEGFKAITSLTELSYLDLIKDFGVLVTCVFIFLFVFPAFQVLHNNYNSSFEKSCLVVPYLAYLFIAGTNPLLISSTGFIVYAVFINLSDKKIEEINY